MLPLKSPIPPQILGSERRGLFSPWRGSDASESMQKPQFGYRLPISILLPPVPSTHLQQVGCPFPQFMCTESRRLHGSSLTKLSRESMEMDGGSQLLTQNHLVTFQGVDGLTLASHEAPAHSFICPLPPFPRGMGGKLKSSPSSRWKRL